MIEAEQTESGREGLKKERVRVALMTCAGCSSTENAIGEYKACSTGAGMCFIVRRHVKKLIGKFIRRVATSEEVVHGISVPKKCCARNIQCHHVILE